MKHNGLKPLKALSSLRPGEEGVVATLRTSDSITEKLMEMGLGEGECVRFIRKAPFGDPIELEVMNIRLALRKSEADKILLKTRNGLSS